MTKATEAWLLVEPYAQRMLDEMLGLEDGSRRGSDSEYPILLYDGNEIIEYSSTATGLAAAIAASASGDTIFGPYALAIALTSGITIPVGVTLQNFTLTYSGFAGTGVTMSNNSHLKASSITYDGSGQATARGLLAFSVAGVTIDNVNIIVSGATGAQTGIQLNGSDATSRISINDIFVNVSGGTSNIGIRLNNHVDGIDVRASVSAGSNLNYAIQFVGTDATTVPTVINGNANATGTTSHAVHVDGNKYGRLIGFWLGTLPNNPAATKDVFITAGATLELYDCRYSTITEDGTLIYLQGDRGAYSVEDFHAEDIEDGQETRHPPAPVSRGDMTYADTNPYWAVLDHPDAANYHMTTNVNDPAWAASITMNDDTWIGLGGAAGRIVFNSTPAPDLISVLNASLTVNVNSATALLVEQDGVNDNVLVVDTTTPLVYGLGANWGIRTATPNLPLSVIGSTMIADAEARDLANSKMTLGLTINQGAADDEIIALKSSDVGHGITNETETDTYATLRKAVNASGGVSLRGFSEGTIGVKIDGVATNDIGTRVAGSVGYCIINAEKKTNGNIGAIGADANLVVFRDSGSTVVIIDAEGTIHHITGDNDLELISLPATTETPILSWDDSETAFDMNVGLNVGDGTNMTKVDTTGDMTFAGTARIDWTKITANNITQGNGTHSGTTGDNSGLVGDLTVAHDGNFYHIDEAAADPGFELTVEFVSVTAFNWVQILATYDGANTHPTQIALYNFSTTTWDVFGAFAVSQAEVATAGEYTLGNKSFFVPSDTNYVGTGGDAGDVRVRFRHTITGNPAHDVDIDVVALYQ